MLGLGLTTQGEGALFMQEAKRLRMLHDIGQQLHSAHDGRSCAARADIEQLVGRLSHTAQLAREGNAFLQPLCRLMCVSHLVRVWARDQHGAVVWRRRRVRPRAIMIARDTSSQQAYRTALRWWSTAIAGGIFVPLAPRRGFPEVGETGCAFLFTDAAWEAGTGFGGFTIVQERGCGSPNLLYVAELAVGHGDSPTSTERRDVYTGRRMLRAHHLGRCSGEEAGRTVTSMVFHGHRCHAVRHHDGRRWRSPIGPAGFVALPTVPGSSVRGGSRVPGIRNASADSLSRGRARAVLAEADAAGLRSERLRPVEEAALVLSQVSLLEHRQGY